MNPSDWSQTPEIQAWFDEVRQDLLPKLRESRAVISVAAEPVDLKLAIEIGLAILLDKPLMLYVPVGRPLPAKLRTVADAVVEESGDTSLDQQRLAHAINQVMGGEPSPHSEEKP